MGVIIAFHLKSRLARAGFVGLLSRRSARAIGLACLAASLASCAVFKPATRAHQAFVAPPSQPLTPPQASTTPPQRTNSERLAEEGLKYLGLADADKARRLFAAAVKFDPSNG